MDQGQNHDRNYFSFFNGISNNLKLYQNQHVEISEIIKIILNLYKIDKNPNVENIKYEICSEECVHLLCVFSKFKIMNL